MKVKVALLCPTLCSLVAQMVKRLPTMQETQVQSLGWEALLEKEMATHSSTLAWKIPSLVGYSLWGHKESDTTEGLHFTSLCDPMDYTVHGILQIRILEWVAFPFSGGSSQRRSPSLQLFFTS